MSLLPERVRKPLLFLARTDIFSFAIFWLMCLVVAGTLAQRSIGLYRAQELFFSSFVYWVGYVPLPGGYTTMGVIFVGMLVKLLFDSTMRNGKLGIWITHFGALLLLLGGFLTAAFSQEGAMAIPPDQTVDYVSDYHKLEFAVTDTSSAQHDQVTAFAQGWLKPGAVLKAPGIPFEVEVVKLFKNVSFDRRMASVEEGDLRGFAVNFDLRSAPEARETEQNQAGALLRVRGAGPGMDGSYAVFEEMPVRQTIEVQGKRYELELRRARTVLPFKIHLVQFEKKMYPGTGMAKSYKSVVLLEDGGVSQRAVIQMNEPLRHRGYTFYQSSFIENPQGDTTVLAVVKNVGRLFPYISSIIMCIGLLVHLMIQSPKLIRGRRVAPLLAGVALLGIGAGAPALAAPTPEFKYADLGLVPILHEGRVKPLDTFARIHLLAFSGRSKLPGQSAMQWLTELLLDDTRAYERKVFNIADPGVVEALGLERVEGHRYSFLEVTRGLQANSATFQQLLDKKEEERSGTQNHMVEVYEKYVRFLEISRSLSVFLPEFSVASPKLAATLDLPVGEKLSFRDLMKRKKFDEGLRALIMSKGAGLSEDERRELADLSIRYDRAQRDTGSEILRIIPPQWQHADDLWLAPAALLGTGLGSPETTRYLNLWKSLHQAYHGGEGTRWNALTAQILGDSREHASKVVRPWKLSLETLYNRLDLFTWSLALYVLSFLALALSWMAWPKALARASVGLLGVGALSHLAGLTLRIIIMGRPPVATLYESIIFVGLVAVIMGLLLEKMRGNGLGVLIGAVSGAALQFMGTRYETSGDTMGMLVAVLNTNFWLATHVVTITIGYGSCFVGGVMGHIYLLSRILKPAAGESARTEEVSRNMVGVALLSLFFTMFGTILGGIWADQSWGRFWGWDPKENGALWIVLWLLFLLHARLAGLVAKVGFAVGMVLTNVIVALAWFGVNLLNVGLHSYGFTKNVAWNLGLFCGGEVLFAVVTYALVKRNEYRLLAAAQTTVRGG
ncbi:MAG: cytochrome c biogenesis protein CcsA [Oligoflexia bacterium]|nr:cytochrome c biogenesis protein CcsA [Oligoflexia bacterium]